MKTYKLRKPYSFSKKLLSGFQASFWLVVITFILVLGVTIFSPEETYSFEATPKLSIIFFAAFALCVALVSAGFTLWIGMLHFLFTYDGGSSTHKAVWLAIIVLGLSYGAALYYLFVFRKFLQKPLGNNVAPSAT